MGEMESVWGEYGGVEEVRRDVGKVRGEVGL